MMVDSNLLVGMTEANQNFSKVARLVDHEGMAVILRNNKPAYLLVEFDEYDAYLQMREERKHRIDETASRILDENMDAFKELAK